MKLERLSEYVLVTVVVSLGMGFALYCGKLTGSGQADRSGAMLLGIAILLLVIKMRANIWVLLPICAGISGNLNLPIPFTIRELSVLLVFGSYLVFMALKIIRRKPVFYFVDFLLLCNLLMLAQAFIRNPVGIEVMNSNRIGGRPYIDVGFAVMAYWVICRAPLTVGLINLVMKGKIAAMGIDSLISAIANNFPSAGYYILKVYKTPYFAFETSATGTDVQSIDSGDSEIGVSRQACFGFFGLTIGLFLFSRFLPLTVIMPIYFGRFALLLFSVTLIFLSGFRNLFAEFGAYFVMASYLKKGLLRILPILSFVLLSVIAVGYLNGKLFDLPMVVQRTLSFLPGNWSYEAIDNAKTSTEWRVEIWERVMAGGVFDGNKYIHNKIIGDGFGFDRVLYEEAMVALAEAALHGGSSQALQEHYQVTGDFHSGPISTIRMVGYVGLAIFMITLITLMRFAWKIMRRASGTPYALPSLFFGLPLVYLPFGFVFIVGAYKDALIESFIGCAMLKLLDYGLNEYARGRAVQSGSDINRKELQEFRAKRPQLVDSKPT